MLTVDVLVIQRLISPFQALIFGQEKGLNHLSAENSGMSCSRKFTRLHVKAAVFLSRFIGWLQGGDPQRSKHKGDLRKASILTDYFARKYLTATDGLVQQEVTVATPETIWQFWDNPAGRTTPEIVKASLGSVEKFKGNFAHKVLDNATMSAYSDLPGYVMDKFKKGQIDYTHFSDLLRLNLLKNHGGIWLDATGYMTDTVPGYILDEDFFVLLTGKLTHFPYSFIQSCFIRAKKGSFLCDAWYQLCVEYWKKEIKKLDYFQLHLMFKALVENERTAKDLFEQMPHIAEDDIQQLIGNKLLEKFDPNEWSRIKEVSFFQKTTYKVPQGTDYSGTYLSALSKTQL